MMYNGTCCVHLYISELFLCFSFLFLVPSSLIIYIPKIMNCGTVLMMKLLTQWTSRYVTIGLPPLIIRKPFGYQIASLGKSDITLKLSYQDLLMLYFSGIENPGRTPGDEYVTGFPSWGLHNLYVLKIRINYDSSMKRCNTVPS